MDLTPQVATRSSLQAETARQMAIPVAELFLLLPGLTVVAWWNGLWS